MKRVAVFASVVIASWCSIASAGSWAEGLFSELKYDFGTVPRGAERRCSFTIRNNTESAVRIVGLARTCGCTLITLDDKVVLDQNVRNARENKVLAPGEETRINVLLDTRSFIGSKTAEITVSFDQPAHADVRLIVSSFIRQDIVLNPGSVQLGSVSRGQEATKDIEIEYAGQFNWQILSVTNANPNMQVSFDEMYRRPGQVGYRLTVTARATMPAGTIRDTLLVETNDPATPQFPVLVSGQVQADLIVTPSNLSFGAVRPGQTVTRQVLLRGKSPFQVTDVEGGAGTFEIEKPQGSQSFHRVIVRFTAGDEPVSREATIRVKTDLADQSAAEFKASAQVIR
jgi:hypothetical protein